MIREYQHPTAEFNAQERKEDERRKHTNFPWK